MVLIPMPGRPGGPDGAQRVRSALKVLRRCFGIRAQWLPSDMATMPVLPERKAGNATRSDNETMIASSEIPRPEIERNQRPNRRNRHER